MKVLTSIVSAAAVFGIASASYGVVLTNPSFEDKVVTDDSQGAPGWGQFNDALTSRGAGGNTGAQALKVFGPFFDGGGAGVFQGGFAATPGQTWTVSAFLKQITGDSLGQNNFAVVKGEFIGAGGVISAFESPQFNASSPMDTFVPFSATGVAPAGTTSVQIVLVHVQLAPVDGGAVFFDDAALVEGVVPEPTSLAAIAGVAGAGLIRRRRRA